MAIDVVMTITSDGDTAQAIQESPAHIGIESSHEWPFESRPHFLDYPFTNESATFEDHLAAAERHRPHITTAPDVEKGRELTDVVSMGDKLLDYSDNVIIVPKTCHPTDIPDRFRVGLTVGNFGSMAPWGLYEYASVDSIHVLGGTPNEQMAVVSHGLNVDSMDSYTLGVRAQYGMWDGVAKDAPDGWDYKKRLQESLTNYVQAVN